MQIEFNLFTAIYLINNLKVTSPVSSIVFTINKRDPQVIKIDPFLNPLPDGLWYWTDWMCIMIHVTICHRLISMAQKIIDQEGIATRLCCHCATVWQNL